MYGEVSRSDGGDKKAIFRYSKFEVQESIRKKDVTCYHFLPIRNAEQFRAWFIGRILCRLCADLRSCTYCVHSRRPLRRLLVPSATDTRNFACSCLFEVRGQELCPIGAKREGKPRYSGVCRAHAVVSPLKFSAKSSLLLFCKQKKSNETEMYGEVSRSDGGDKKVRFR